MKSRILKGKLLKMAQKEFSLRSNNIVITINFKYQEAYLMVDDNKKISINIQKADKYF